MTGQNDHGMTVQIIAQSGIIIYLRLACYIKRKPVTQRFDITIHKIDRWHDLAYREASGDNFH